MQVPPRSRGMRVVLAGVGLLVVVALPLLLAKRFSHRPPDRSGEQVEPATVYRNTKPDVAYVGDQACADCHPAQTEGYRRHPMGRSLARVSASTIQPFDPSTHNAASADGLHYRVEKRSDQLLQHEFRLDTQGRAFAEIVEPVQYIIGSGARTYSFLIDQKGIGSGPGADDVLDRLDDLGE